LSLAISGLSNLTALLEPKPEELKAAELKLVLAPMALQLSVGLVKGFGAVNSDFKENGALVLER
jgi:hypothetical protein